MRNAFANEITQLAAVDSRIVLLSGDIGNRLFNDYKDKVPGRFFNCGVAEANMAGMAAGLALSGFRPFIYTITPFCTTRCLEQIRVDICYHNLSVVIVGVGAGLSYARLGPTHHSCEDISFLRSIPNMKVVCPGDALEVRAALRASMKNDGPLYIRMGKKNEPMIHDGVPEMVIGKSITVRHGEQICLLSTGNTLPIACDAAAILSDSKISVRVESFHTVKPLDASLLEEVFGRYELVVTLEEHSPLGGLGGAVAEWVADRHSRSAPLIRIGTGDQFIHTVGDQTYVRNALGISGQAIASKILAFRSGGNR